MKKIIVLVFFIFTSVCSWATHCICSFRQKGITYSVGYTSSGGCNDTSAIDYSSGVVVVTYLTTNADGTVSLAVDIHDGDPNLCLTNN